MQRRTPLFIGAGLLVLASAGLVAWRVGGDVTTGADAGRWQRPQQRVLRQPVLLKGTLLPVTSVNLTAPADGRLVERPAQFGERVSAGQFVARIESPELLNQLRDAEIAAIRADQDLASARSVDQGAEHQAVQRRLRQAEGVLSTARHRAAETQMLYDKGVVARVELEGAQQEVQNAEAQLQGARDEIDALLQKRSRNALRILELEAQGRR
jgi:HlyD family secretion protein